MATTTDQQRILTADDIWAAKDIEEKDVFIEEWGGSVRVRSLSLKQVSEVAKRATRPNPRTRQDDIDRELSAVFTVVEGMVEPKLTLADVERLKARSATAITRIVQAISSFGVSDEAITEADKSPSDGSVVPIPIHADARVGWNDESGIADAHVGA